MNNCILCNVVFNNLILLARHCLNKHQIDSKSLYLKLFCNDIVPLCECGCGEPTSFLTIVKGFRKFSSQGHSIRINNHMVDNPKRLENLRKTLKENAVGKIKKICLSCLTEFECWNSQTDRKFCSVLCSNKEMATNGISQIKYQETMLRDYDVTNILLTKENKAKAHSKESMEKMKETNLRIRGCENVFQDPEIKDRSRQTNLENRGVEYPTQSVDVINEMKNTNMMKRGVEFVFQDPKVKEDIKNTNLKKRGVENPSQDPEVKNKKIETCRRNHNVDYPMQSKDIMKKSLDTFAQNKNGENKTSKEEIKFKKFLEEKFLQHNVISQSRVENWLIDFHIQQLNTYIQFDGTYWHGYEGNVDIFLPPPVNKREKGIYRTIIEDIKQNNWFEENKIKLYRLTNKEFKYYLRNDSNFLYQNIIDFHNDPSLNVRLPDLSKK